MTLARQSGLDPPDAAQIKAAQLQHRPHGKETGRCPLTVRSPARSERLQILFVAPVPVIPETERSDDREEVLVAVGLDRGWVPSTIM